MPRSISWRRRARSRRGRRRACGCSGRCPRPCHRRAGRYHAQLLIESRERAPLHEFLGEWLERVAALKSARAVRWSLDVDPLELY